MISELLNPCFCYTRKRIIRRDFELNFTFIKKLSIILIVSAFILSGCGMTTQQDDKETYEPVVKESTSNDDEASTAVAEDKTQIELVTTPTENTTNQIPVTLVSTTDGDTIRVMYNGVNEPVRYLLIDTPETNHPRLGKQPFGDEAKELNRSLVNSGALTIEFDVGEKRDKYGRLLAYVYVDGKSVQEILLRAGLARVAYVYPPNTRHLTPYEKAQREAKSKKLGIWSVEDYATDSGFVSTSPSPSESAPVTANTPNAPTEKFDNCTHLRTKYPTGVASDHPAYQAKMDRDNDNWACE